MTWLNAALAFALSMIVFSTIVSSVLEVIHRLLQVREDGLERMMGRLFDEKIAPRLSTALASTTDAPRKDFLATMLRNRAVESRSWLPLGVFSPRRLASLDVHEFLHRLPETAAGRELVDRARGELAAVGRWLATEFARVETDASAYFYERARVVSVAIALGLAFVLNVDAVRLFESFVTDQQLTARLVGQAEAIQEAYTAQQQRLAAAATAEGRPQPAGAAVPAVPAGPAGDDEQEERLAEARADLERALDAATVLGLPIGNEFYPWCAAGANAKPEAGEAVGPAARPRDPRCGAPSGHAALRILGWLGSTILTGLLIGLGGPFWFNAFGKLSELVSLLGPSGKEEKTKHAVSTAGGVAPSVPAGAPASGAATVTPTEPGAVLVAAVAASLPSRRPRRLLRRDGQPM